MKIKNKLVLLIGLFSMHIQAQESISLQSPIMPNRTFHIINSSDMELKMDIKGNDEIKKIMAAKMGDTAMRMKSSQTITNQFLAKKGEKIPFIYKVKNQESISQLFSPKNTNENKEWIIYGYYDKALQINIDSSNDKTLEANLKTWMPAISSDLGFSNKFPAHPIKIGDTFSQSEPMELPMSEFGTFKMNVRTIYKLKEIKKSTAIFDLTQSLSLENVGDNSNMKIHASGGGNGVLEYNYLNHYSLYQTSTLFLNMEMEIADMVLIQKIKTKQETNTTLE